MYKIQTDWLKLQLKADKMYYKLHIVIQGAPNS